MMALPMELRERVLKVCDEGASHKDAAERFLVGVRTVERWIARRRRTGSVAPVKPPGRPRGLSVEQRETLRREACAAPDATLAELRERSGIDGSLTRIHNELRRLGFSRKKSRSMPPSGTVQTSSDAA